MYYAPVLLSKSLIIDIKNRELVAGLCFKKERNTKKEDLNEATNNVSFISCMRWYHIST